MFINRWVLALGIAAAGIGSAQAACSTKALGGFWALLSSTGSVCLFQANRTGRFIHSRCYTDNLTAPQGSLVGSLRVSPSCEVSGVVTQRFSGRSYRFTIDGTMSRDLNSMAGAGSGDGISFRFDALKQW